MVTFLEPTALACAETALAHAFRTKRFRVRVTANGKLRICQNRKEANENSPRQFF